MSDILKRQQQQTVNIADLERRKRQVQQQQQQVEQQPDNSAEALAARQEYYRQKSALDREIAKFESENVKLDTGEWIPRSQFEQLSAEDQQRIKQQGIAGFNQYQKNLLAEYEQNYVQLNTGEWVDKSYYNDLPAEWQNELKARGVTGWQNWWNSKPYGGKTEFVVGELFGQPRVFGKTSDPLIGVDASGMNVYLGDTWPEHIIRYTGDPDTSPGYKEALGKPLVPADVTLPSILEERERIDKLIKSGDLIRTSKNELIEKNTYNKLPEKYKKIVLSQGIEAANKQFIQEQTRQPETIKLRTGELIVKSEYEKLSSDQKELVNKQGIAVLAKQQESFTKENMQLPDGNYVPVKEFYEMPEAMRIEALEKGLNAIDLEKMPPEKQFEKMKEWGMIEKNMEYGGTDETGQIILKDGTPLWQRLLTLETAKDVGIGMIPIAGTLYHWENSKWWENGLSVALDVASFIPFVGAVSTGVRAGAKGAKAVSKIVGRAALAEVKAPLTAIAHPIATTKAALYPLETALRPSKIPLTALEIRYNTVRLPVKDVGKAEDAMQARDIITKNAIMGDKPSIEIAGKKIELGKVALQQKTMPAAIHATPDVRVFMNGLTVQGTREGGLFVAPTLHTRFTGASAFGDMPEGGIPGAIIIRDKKVLETMQPSGKIFRKTAEIEQKLPELTKLSPPSQVLMTRDAAGNKLALAIIGDPLSPAEIARLKIQGSIDLVKDIFRPAIKVGDKGVEYVDKIADLGKEARQLEKELSVAQKAGKLDDAKRIKAEINSLDRRASDLARRIDTTASSRTSLRAGALSTGEFIDRLAYNEAARTKPSQLAEALRGASKTERSRILNEIDSRYRKKVQRELAKPAVRAARTDTASRIGLRPGISVPRADIARTDIPRADIPRTRIDTPRVDTPRTDTPRTDIPRADIPRIRVTNVPMKTDITPPPLSGDNQQKWNKLTQKQFEAAIGWKQGLFYIYRYPPWGKYDVIYSQKPLPGIKTYDGIGSAAKSAVVLYGTLPGAMQFDLGAFDVQFFKTNKPGRPRVVFKRDKGQKTTHAGVIGSRK